jgi:hypothetical protein
MSVIVWLLDGLAALTAPYWLTLQALGAMISEAGAGTALVGSFLLLLSLDFLRASKGLFVPVARALSVAFTLFVLASFVYGDFLAAPAKAAYSAIVARSDSVPPNVVVLTTLGAAGGFLVRCLLRCGVRHPRPLRRARRRSNRRSVFSCAR